MPNTLPNISEMKLRDFEASLSIPEFCTLEGISVPTYYKIKHAGLGPDEMRYLSVVRITPASRIAWQKKMQAHKERRAAKIEQKRRTALAKHAARASVQAKKK